MTKSCYVNEEHKPNQQQTADAISRLRNEDVADKPAGEQPENTTLRSLSQFDYEAFGVSVELQRQGVLKHVDGDNMLAL